MPIRKIQHRVSFSKNKTTKRLQRKLEFTTNGNERGREGGNKIKNPAFDMVPGKCFSIIVISKSVTFKLNILFLASFATDEVMTVCRQKTLLACKLTHKHQLVILRPLDNFACFNDLVNYLVLWIVHILILLRSVIWLAFNDVQNNHVTQHCCLQKEEKYTCHIILSHSTAKQYY